MPPPLHFERPHAALADSYRALVREFVDRGEPFVPFPLKYAHDDFDAFLRLLDECRRGVGLAEGFVANSTYWLVREGVDVVAVSNLRHALTDSLRREGGHVGYGVRPTARGNGYSTAILRHTLDEARALGIADVLVTCAKENEPSARAIVRCGGRLEAEEWIAERAETVQRYWIGLEASGGSPGRPALI